MGIKKYFKNCVAFALVFVFILQLAQSASPVMAENVVVTGSSSDISAASAGNTTTAAAEKTALVWVFDDTDEHGDPAPLYIDPENYDEATAFMDGVKVTDPDGNEIENGLTMEVDIGGFSIDAAPGKMFTVTYKASHADWKNATITRQAGVRPTAETTNPTETTTPTTPTKAPALTFTFANVDENGKPKPLYINPTTYDETNRLQIFMNGVTVTDENNEPVQTGLTIEVDIGTFAITATPGEMFEIKYKATHINGLTTTATRQAAVQLPRGGLARTAYTVSTFAQLKSAINGAGTGAHTITVTADFVCTEQLTIPPNKQFTITGSGSRTLGISTTNKHFYVYGTNASLTIGNGITLQGRKPTAGGGVYLWNGATFTMEGTSVITNIYNTFDSGLGGGVTLAPSCTFIMNGGTISNNNGSNGGAVFINNGIFRMTGGTITGNAASNRGGGVYMANASHFTMTNGATISNNTAYLDGGGVVSENGTFILDGGTITDNTTGNSECNGGGVAVYGTSGTFKMISGTISSNNSLYGGGIAVFAGTNFEMSGGSIEDNTATGSGGGL